MNEPLNLWMIFYRSSTSLEIFTPVKLVKELLKYVGLETERFKMSWVSAAEGKKYTEIIKEFVDEITPLGPQTKLRRNL